MKKRQNNSTRASALQITLSAALISISAVLLASSFKAAPAASELNATITPALHADNTLTSGAWTATGSLNTARGGHTATLLPNGKVLVAGGNYGDFPTSTELYDPANGSWTVTGSLHTGRYGHTATLLPNGKVLVAGGSNSGSFVNQAELYDPASGSWTVTGSLNSGRWLHTATLLPNGKVLVAGWFTVTELYDPASGSWTVTGSLHSERFAHTATLLPNGKVLVAAGQTHHPVVWSTAELYDPASGNWTLTGNLNAARTSHAAALLPTGTVLVMGGINSSNLPDPELYDPASGTWSSTGSLATSRYAHTSTFLPNGEVLVAGGRGNNNGDLASAELYDPATGSWAATGSLNTARNSHTATLLPNGKVLVAGGFGNNGTVYLNSAELYDAEPAMCSVCHKHTLALSLPCNSLEYQRHIDHGDTAGACPSVASPLIISPLSIFGNINRQLVYQIVATGNPQSYVAANLPAGLALDPVLGIISGIPVVGGTIDVTITAANSQGMDVKTLRLRMFDPSFPNPPFIANVGSLTARTGQPFAFDVIGRGLDSGHVVTAMGSAPGIVFRPLTNDLVGTPQEDGSFAINFYIHTPPPLDDLIYNTQTLQVTFVSDPALPVITSAASVTLVPGEPFTYTITAPNTAAPNDHNHYSLIGTLPSGLVFDSNAGTISGTYSPVAPKILNAGVGPVDSFVATVTLVAQNSHGAATLPLTFLLP